jgi:hypothetical protein
VTAAADAENLEIEKAETSVADAVDSSDASPETVTDDEVALAD